jgi:hypothetical protein
MAEEQLIKTLKEYIKKGWVRKETKFEDIKYDDDDPYLDEDKITLPVGYITSDGYVDTKVVLWL